MPNSNTFGRFKHSLIALVTTAFIASPLSADDTDVFDAVINNSPKPNLLFVVDYSGSMNQSVNNERIPEDDTTTLSKIEVLRNAITDLIDNNTNTINAGIGSIFDSQSSGPKWPISELSAYAHSVDPDIAPETKTVADVLKQQFFEYDAMSRTRIVNGLASAAAYWRGDDYLNNGKDPDDTRVFTPAQWDPVSERYVGGNRYTALPATYSPSTAYTSIPFPAVPPKFVQPAMAECQGNYMILVSDGLPTEVLDTPEVRNILTAAGLPADQSGCETLPDANGGKCAPEITKFLASNDVNPSVPGSIVKTFSIGFSLEGVGQDFLRRLAEGDPNDPSDEGGQGQFFEANEADDLTTALQSILDSILGESQNFAELSIDVKPDSFSHDNRAFFSLFAPSAGRAWQGNLKGFFLGPNGLVDVNQQPATETIANGVQFINTAQSFWSSVADGSDTLLGGASESITELADAPNNRNMVTYFPGNSRDLTNDANNYIEKGNTQITDALMGFPGAATREESLDWLANAPMGDPLHTKPVLVRYAGDQQVVFTMTNQGFLHAFDATTPVGPTGTPDTSGGEELFAFMPSNLLKNIPLSFSPPTFGEHVYGLDGGMTRWHTDENNNGIVDGSDTMLLVFGMRRGGGSYYALDITNPDRPTFRWEINATTPGMANLAQSWSRPSLVTVTRNGRQERVLMFGGGYDAAVLDDNDTRNASDGNAIFMVDANGTPVWSVSNVDHPQMQYAIPSDLTVLDTNSDGAVDRIYVGDYGGQMWRVDVGDVAIDAETKVTLLADIGQGPYEPIFYPPSVSINSANGERFLALAFGTGDRTNPLGTNTNNNFYMVRDTNIQTGPPAIAPALITPNSLLDATSNSIGDPDPIVRAQWEEDLRNSDGWFVSLGSDEKSLSQVVSFEGKFLATTFTSSGLSADGCSLDMSGSLYIMDILDASPISIEADGSVFTEGLTQDRRVTTLASSSIPSSPVLTSLDGSDQLQLIVDKEVIAPINRATRAVFWHAR